MTRKYSLVIEGAAGGYSAYVPELPTILVTGTTKQELTARAVEAIGIYWETIRPTQSATADIHEVEVELPV